MESTLREGEEYHKCGKEKGFCSTMEIFTQPGNEGRPKGLSFYAVLKTGVLDKKEFSLRNSISVIGVVYRRTANDRGIILNFCPFCGESLKPFRDGV